MDLTKVFEILKVEALDESAKAEVEKFITDLVDIKAKDKALEISEAVLAEAREELTEEFEQKFEDYKEETLSKWSDFVDSVIAEELQIPEEIKEERRDAIMELQQDIAFDKSQDMIGQTLEVIIEGKVADESAYVGRSYMDAPNVDGFVFVNTDEELMSGDFVPVKITGALEYDLIGEIDYEFTK